MILSFFKNKIVVLSIFVPFLKKSNIYIYTHMNKVRDLKDVEQRKEVMIGV